MDKITAYILGCQEDASKGKYCPAAGAKLIFKYTLFNTICRVYGIMNIK